MKIFEWVVTKLRQDAKVNGDIECITIFRRKELTGDYFVEVEVTLSQDPTYPDILYMERKAEIWSAEDGSSRRENKTDAFYDIWKFEIDENLVDDLNKIAEKYIKSCETFLEEI